MSYHSSMVNKLVLLIVINVSLILTRCLSTCRFVFYLASFDINQYWVPYHRAMIKELVLQTITTLVSLIVNLYSRLLGLLDEALFN